MKVAIFLSNYDNPNHFYTIKGEQYTATNFKIGGVSFSY